ncbi:hypothetical protein BJX99DRAFT_220579 [Aspergillus californicus]
MGPFTPSAAGILAQRRRQQLNATNRESIHGKPPLFLVLLFNYWPISCPGGYMCWFYYSCHSPVLRDRRVYQSQLQLSTL